VAFGPMRKRWPEAHDGTRRSGAGQRRRRSGVQRKENPGWAELGWSGPRTGPSSGNSKENRGRLPRPLDRVEEMNRKGP
jgi:hypothetical protein